MKSIFEQLDPKLLIKSKNLSVLTHILQEVLPTQSHLHFQVVNINQHTLFVMTDTPVWATKLRQLAPVLIELLHKKRHNRAYNINLGQLIPETIRHIQVLTRPGQMVSTPPLRTIQNQRNISAQVATWLTQTADYINDAELSQALHRLSQLRKP